MLDKQKLEKIVESLENGSIFTDSLLTITKLGGIRESIVFSVTSSLFDDIRKKEILSNNKNPVFDCYQLYVDMVNENISILKNKMNTTISKLLANGVSSNLLDDVGFNLDVFNHYTLSKINNEILTISNTRLNILDIVKSLVDSNSFTIKDFDSLNTLELIICKDYMLNNKQILELLTQNK